MSIIEKVFRYEQIDLPIIKYKDKIWIKVVNVATFFKYKNTKKSIRDHVDPKDRARFDELHGGNELFPLTNNERNTISISESELYSLIHHSKLESARVFKAMSNQDVLLSIRKTGRYIYDDMDNKYNDRLTFKIESELDLHIKVVSFLKKRYPNSILMLHWVKIRTLIIRG